jgi:DNA-binding response OmpR family regulator
MLPGISGIEVCRLLRAKPETRDIPIIMLTARSEESDKLVGLELGADDYLTKPFSPKELVARVRAVLRRAEATARPAEDAQTVQAADLVLDIPRMRALRGGQPVDLTPTEFQLLVALARQPGRVFSRAQLLDAVRGVAIESYERAIDAHVKNIRRKLEPDPRAPRYVLTVYGIGYKFADD